MNKKGIPIIVLSVVYGHGLLENVEIKNGQVTQKMREFVKFIFKKFCFCSMVFLLDTKNVSVGKVFALINSDGFECVWID